MPAQHPLHTLPVRVSRVMCALAGILLLLLQMLGPALASPGQSMWVEICSEAGAVWVQVDLEEGTEDPTVPCPKCADCALCAVTSAGPLTDPAELARPPFVCVAQTELRDRPEPTISGWLWPETRGPPAAPEYRTERALRVSMVSTQTIGGAPWS